jgi:hypothetical protein
MVEEDAGRHDREVVQHRLQLALGDRRADQRAWRLRQSHALDRRPEQRRVVVCDQRARDRRLDPLGAVDEGPVGDRAVRTAQAEARMAAQVFHPLRPAVAAR